MCGIVGKINFSGQAVTPDQIKKMADAISYRGPDDAGVFIDGQIGLGHRRLSIIDLSAAGHQPMSDDSGKIWIVFNGEIYNFPQLRQELENDGIKFKSKTDTETIIYLYKKYGADCLKYLNGMFAFAIWDDNKEELFIARDQLGKKPLKYYLDDKNFIFASELKAILTNPEVKKEVDFKAIDEYLTYQYIPQPKTGFKNIFKLPPATYLIINKNGVVKQKKYWQLNFQDKFNWPQARWENEITDKLIEATKTRLIADVPLGAHLSGGIDSGMVVALMSMLSEKPIETFSIGFGDKQFDELTFARLVAKRYHTNHHEFVVQADAVSILPELVYHYEEPFCDSSIIPTWYLCQQTRQQVTVALNGDGGDENFAGYHRYNHMARYNILAKFPLRQTLKNSAKITYAITKSNLASKSVQILQLKNQLEYYNRLMSLFKENNKNEIYTQNFKNQLIKSELSHNDTIANKMNWLDELLAHDIDTYLTDDLLVKVDIASMANALEVRSPFLDIRFMELTAKMPAKLKLKYNQNKYILKKIAKKYLPTEIINRPKQGFGSPLEYWFKNGSFDKTVDSLKQSSRLKSFINTEYLKNITMENKNTSKLWSLLVLDEWLKIFFND